MTFDEALQYATERARECLLEINNNNLNDLAAKGMAGVLYSAMQNESVHPTLALFPNSLDEFFKLAEENELIWNACIYLIELFRNKPRPSQLDDFTIKVVRGDIKKPVKKGPNNGSITVRNLHIIETLYELKNNGINPTRNDADDPNESPSGCDIVAEAFKNEGYLNTKGKELKYGGIAEIYRNRSPELIFKLAKELENYPTTLNLS